MNKSVVVAIMKLPAYSATTPKSFAPLLGTQVRKMFTSFL